jgi:hypothetical protein
LLIRFENGDIECAKVLARLFHGALNTSDKLDGFAWGENRCFPMQGTFPVGIAILA